MGERRGEVNVDAGAVMGNLALEVKLSGTGRMRARMRLATWLFWLVGAVLRVRRVRVVDLDFVPPGDFEEVELHRQALRYFRANQTSIGVRGGPEALEQTRNAIRFFAELSVDEIARLCGVDTQGSGDAV